MSIRLFVGNLPYDATEADVREHFSAIAPPSKVVLPVDRETGRPRGFAFVEFGERAQGEEAVRRLNAQPYRGRSLSVSEARPREERAPGAPPSRPGGPPMRSGGPPFARPAPSFDGGGMGFPPRGGDRPARSFGPPAKSAKGGRGAKPERGGPKGPIREKNTGRLMDLDDDPRHRDDPSDPDDLATSAVDPLTEDPMNDDPMNDDPKNDVEDDGDASPEDNE